jgi:hypothetical protein
MTNPKTSAILEFTKKQLHHCWFALSTGLVFGLTLLLALNSISIYRWVSRPMVLEQPQFEMHAPIVAKTAVFSPLPSHQTAWSLRRALYINVVASLVLLVALTLLGLVRRV